MLVAGGINLVLLFLSAVTAVRIIGRYVQRHLLQRAVDESVRPTARQLRWTMSVLFVSLLLVNIAWPYLLLRPSLLREAKKDVLALPLPPAKANLRTVNIGDVVVLGDGTRLRPICDSHHNGLLAYDGSTYVNVNNRVFYAPGGHCGPDWVSPVDDLSAVGLAELIGELDRIGYREVNP